jgi:hypothetical protein
VPIPPREGKPRDRLRVSWSRLAGTWVDTTAAPRFPSDAAIRAAAARGASHFGYRPNALYSVLTPHGKSTLGFGVQWCAYHDNATFNGQSLA